MLGGGGEGGGKHFGNMLGNMFGNRLMLSLGGNWEPSCEI
jgi:hypothetical protein